MAIMAFFMVFAYFLIFLLGAWIHDNESDYFDGIMELKAELAKVKTELAKLKDKPIRVLITTVDGEQFIQTIEGAENYFGGYDLALDNFEDLKAQRFYQDKEKVYAASAIKSFEILKD